MFSKDISKSEKSKTTSFCLFVITCIKRVTISKHCNKVFKESHAGQKIKKNVFVMIIFFY